MKTITMSYDEYLAMEGELTALRNYKRQSEELTDEMMLGMTPDELQKIRSDVKHPLWEAADRQLQLRQANAERLNTTTFRFRGK